MFTYCLNNPSNYSDPTGTRVQLWPILFDDHDPGFIHRTVQAHIISTGLFRQELYLPGIGRADIYDPETGEIREIKHGGSTPEMQCMRIHDAQNQVARYKNNQTIIPLQIGHAGAFTGAFIINCGNISYCISYETPEPGAVLYYVQQMQAYDTAASYSYVPRRERDGNWLGALCVPALAVIGASPSVPVHQKAYSTY